MASEIFGGKLDEDGSFPFSITLCRPSVVGEGLPYAEVLYGKKHTYQVVRWPCYSLPFELGATGKLEIHVYLAEDDLAFKQQHRKFSGGCFLNLETLHSVYGLQEFRLPLEVSPARSRLWPAVPPSSVPRGVVVTTLRVLVQRREKLAAMVWALSVGDQDFSKVFEPMVDSSEEQDLVMNRWRAKYEKQKAAVEALRKEHDLELQKLSDRMQRYDVKVAATMELAGRILWQRLAHVALRTWAGWVADEKNQRQFDQLDEDARLFQGQSAQEKKEQTQHLRQLEREKALEQQRTSQLRRRRAQHLGLCAAQLQRLQRGGRLSAAWAAWQRRKRRGRQLRRVEELISRRGTDLLQQIVLSAWCGLLGSSSLRLTAARVSALDDAKAQRQWRSRAAARAAEQPRPRHVLDAVLQMWIWVVEEKRKERLVANLGDFIAKRISSTAGLLSWCFCRWVGAANRFESRVQETREAQEVVLQRRRGSMKKVMEVPCRVLPTMARFAFGCWQDVARHTKVQKSLELQHLQREQAETQLCSDRKEMQRLQVVASQEEAAWATERAELLERFQHLRSRQSEAETKLQSARERRMSVEAQQAKQMRRVRELQQQLLH